MNSSDEEYMADVLSQLTCNVSDEHKGSVHITYEYTSNEINTHAGYFRKCRKRGLSAYKALMYFSDYLEGEYDI